MLYDIHGNEQKSIPHRGSYDLHRSHMTDAEHEGVIARVHQIMDEATEEGIERDEAGMFNSSWVAGWNWNGTPFQPIYHACAQDEEVAKLFYGLLVWEAVMLHEADWVFHRMKSTSDRPLGMSYFQRQ